MTKEKMIEQREERIVLLLDVVNCMAEGTKYCGNILNDMMYNEIGEYAEAHSCNISGITEEQKEAVAWLHDNPQAYGGEI